MEGQLLERKDGPLSNTTTGTGLKKDLVEGEETLGHVTYNGDQDGEMSKYGNEEEPGLKTESF